VTSSPSGSRIEGQANRGQANDGADARQRALDVDDAVPEAIPGFRGGVER
jgi:hypothetical protein